MASVKPDPKKIKPFRTAAAFEKWLSANHDRETEIWIQIFKKDSGLPTVTHPQALEIALCWGWIDAIRKPFDDESFLQRFTPRRPKSLWSQVNRDNIARLRTAGRMTPHGEKQVDLAKADGRWDAAYAPIRGTRASGMPADLRKAIKANAKAETMFHTLNRQNLFALRFRTNNMKTVEGRARKIAELVAKLARGEMISRARVKQAKVRGKT